MDGAAYPDVSSDTEPNRQIIAAKKVTHVLLLMLAASELECDEDDFVQVYFERKGINPEEPSLLVRRIVDGVTRTDAFHTERIADEKFICKRQWVG